MSCGCIGSQCPVQILEVGFGDANLTFTLAHKFPTARIHGVDVSSERVRQARALAASTETASRVQFSTLNADAGIASIEEHSKDLFVAVDVLEHVFDVFGFVQGASRTLKAGGLLLLRVPNIGYAKHRIALLRGQLPVTSSWFGPPNDLGSWRSTWGWDGGHLHYFTLDTLSALLKESGFDPIKWGDPGAKGERLRAFAPSLLLGNLGVLARRR